MPRSPCAAINTATATLATTVIATLIIACGGGGGGGDDGDEMSGPVENSPIILEAIIVKPGASDPVSELDFNEDFMFHVEVVDPNQDADMLYISSYFPSDRSTPLVEPVPLFLAENVESQIFKSVVHKAGPYIGEYRIEFYVVDFEGNESDIETVYVDVTSADQPIEGDKGTAPVIESIQVLNATTDQLQSTFAIGDVVKFRITFTDPDIDTDVVEWMGFFPHDRISNHLVYAPFKTYQDQEKFTLDYEETVGIGSFLGRWRFEFIIVDNMENRSNIIQAYLEIVE